MEIKTLIFNAGSNSESDSLEHEAGKVTVFIGPNNSGKSQVLRDISSISSGAIPNHIILSDIKFSYSKNLKVELRNISGIVESIEKNAEGEQVINLKFRKISGEEQNTSFKRNDLEKILQDGATTDIARTFLDPFVITLDGRSRFQLTEAKPIDGYNSRPKHHLWSIFKDSAVWEEIDDLIYDTFGYHFLLDPYDFRNIKVKVNENSLPRGYKSDSIVGKYQSYINASLPIEQVGDGVGAFIGIISALFSANYNVILLDEPEVFLHPTLIQKLGQNVVDLAIRREGKLFASTHSSDFLQGCLATTTDISIIRLTYQNGLATARSFSGEEIRSFMHDPMLRATGVIRGLFHTGVIVTEGDSDRVFYEEINRRLLNAQRGIADSIFLNAQNVQTIPRMVEVLRRIGIPAAAIMDLDVLKNNEKDWENIYKTFNIPRRYQPILERKRKEVTDYFKALPRNSRGEKGEKRIKSEGISSLQNTQLVKAQNLLNTFNKYGLFLVPVGELEYWLSTHNIGAGPKNRWIERIFNVIGTFDDDPNFVPPKKGDVWSFLDEIGRWVKNTNRKGIK